MTSRISLTTSWIQIATGASIVSVEGEAEIAIQAAAPAAGFAGHRLSSGDDPLDYAGALAVWARGVSPSSVAIVSGANVQPSVAPVAAVAPAVTTPPSMVPANPTVGATVTIALGAASGVPTPKVLDAQLVVGGERVAIDSTPVKLPRAGPWSLNVVWGNGVAPNAVGSASGTVAAPAGASAPAQMAAPTLTGGTGQATVSFAAAPANGGSAITGYGYQITLASDPTFSAPVATGSQATRADVTVTGLAAGSYIAWTRAGNAVGDGAWSAASAAATVAAAGGSGFLGAAVQTFGNVAVSGTPLASNAPASRKLALIGDSRVAGVASGQLGGEAASVSGEWVWIDHRTFNYGLGGSSIWHARNTQVPAALADGCKTYVVLTGHNGARQAGEGDGVDTLATRQAETLALLAALDAVGNTIFLCNEMPGQTTGPGTTAIKVAHHAWIETLTKTAAGLVNADLVIVDTWAAVADNAAEDTSTSIDTRWTSDGLHPGDQGTERMAYAIWYAMNGFFTQPHLNIGSPAQRLLDGTTTATINRGTVPSGWTDFTAADGLVYSTAGTGANTVLTVTNTSGSAKTMALRRTPAAVTDGVLMVEYDLDHDAGVSRSIGTTSRAYDNGHSARNFTMGSGANIAIYAMWGKDVSGTGQERELGGRRRVTTRLGPSAASPRVDLGFSIPAGMTVRIHAVNIYER